MSSQLSAHAITAHTAMTRMSINRCSTLPEHRGSSSAEKCSTSFSTDIAVLPSLTKRKPARLIRTLDPTCPFHASPLMQQRDQPGAALVDDLERLLDPRSDHPGRPRQGVADPGLQRRLLLQGQLAGATPVLESGQAIDPVFLEK